MNILDKLFHTTVRIECRDAHGKDSTGTGFIFRFCERDKVHVPAVVTSKHVVRDAVTCVIHMTTANDKDEPILGEHVMVPMENFGAFCVKHPDEDIDLAVFPMTPIAHWMEQQGKKPFYAPVSSGLLADAAFMDELSAIEEIVMIGYPNGLWDSKNNLPIARRGTTATPPYINFEGRPEFMIDCACFPGSSGSPVFLWNNGAYTTKKGELKLGTRIKLLGILWAGPQYTAEGEIVVVPVPSAMQPIVRSRIPNNLGYCIKADQLLAFEKHFEQFLPAETAETQVKKAQA